MSELQIALLSIGLAVIIAVYLFGWWQQRLYKRKFGAVFRASQTDALYHPGEAKLPAQIDPLPIEVLVTQDDAMPDGKLSGVSTPDEFCTLLDASTDYIALISPKSLTGADGLMQLWQRRFDFGKNIHVCGLNVAGGTWGKVIPESRLPYASFKLALQLVSRAGAVSESRLADFRDLARVIATQLHADVVLPDVTEAAARALDLDKFCASVDQMIGLNIVPLDGRVLTGIEISHLAEKYELSLQPDGLFHMLDTHGHSLFSLGNFDNTPFQHHALDLLQVGELTLLLDVPCANQPVLRFDQMVSLALQLVNDLGADIVDDRHVSLSEAGIALIRKQVSVIEGKMLAGNIVPGSAQARRLFS